MTTVGDRVLVAGYDRLTELTMPFTLATGVTPARDETVPPSLAEVVVRFSRPIAPPSVNDGSVRLIGPSGAVPLTLSVTADFASLTFAIHAVPQAAIVDGADSRIEVDS